jgi:hypothetical protein
MNTSKHPSESPAEAGRAASGPAIGLLFEDASSEYGYGVLMLTGGILLSCLCVGLLLLSPPEVNNLPGVYTFRVSIALLGMVLALFGFLDARRPKWSRGRKRVTGVLGDSARNRVRYGTFDLKVGAPSERPETGLTCPVVSCRRRRPFSGGSFDPRSSWSLTLEASNRSGKIAARVTGLEITRDGKSWRAKAPPSTGILWLLDGNGLEWLQGYAPDPDQMEDSLPSTLRSLERFGERVSAAKPDLGGIRLRFTVRGEDDQEVADIVTAKGGILEMAGRLGWELEIRGLPER